MCSCCSTLSARGKDHRRVSAWVIARMREVLGTGQRAEIEIMQVAREALYALSNYYPETLGCSVFLNMPWPVKMFVNLMWPFVDPVTKRKVRFAASVEQFAAEEKELVQRPYLLKEAGGDLDVGFFSTTRRCPSCVD